jgi:hypothetical protein
MWGNLVTGCCTCLICIFMLVDAKFKLPQVTVPLAVFVMMELLVGAGFWHSGLDFGEHQRTTSWLYHALLQVLPLE